MVEKRSFTDYFIDIIIYFSLTLVTLLTLLPIINTVAISFSSKAAATAGKVFLFPIDFTLSAYKNILNDNQFFVSFWNSILRVVLGASLNFIITLLMAYPLSKTKNEFKLRNIYMWYLVFSMLFYGGLIPSYMLLNSMNLLDTIWVLVLPCAVPPFNVIVLMNFIRGLPRELEEAAKIDGASPWYILFKIIVPLATPCIATITLFSIVAHWNNFMDGVMYINSTAKIPLQTYIQQLVVEIRDMSSLTTEEKIALSQLSTKTFNAAKVFVTMLPVLCVYPVVQKYFVHGLVLGSVKG